MKQVSLLRSSAAVAAFASIMIIAVANAAHAQTGAATTTQSGAAAQTASTAGQPPAGWNETTTAQRSWLSRIFGSSASASAASDQASASPGWSSSGREDVGCRQSDSGQEDFLCKLARIFWGPDTPRGPNRDMDDNVAAGGAGG